MIQAIHTKIATPGPGYLATSTSSATIAATGTITLTTQSGLAYTPGARVRASYTADGTKWMEGIVTSYAGTTLAFTADTSNGSGTYASWNLNLAGQPGAATAVTVGTTTTGAAGTSASVTNSGTAYAPTLNFTIPQGAQGVPGSAVNPRGAYASGTTYAQFDGVTYSGLTYISLAGSNTGHQPDISPTWWQAVGSSGLADPGANGVMTRTGLNVTAPAKADDLSSPVYATASGTNSLSATLSPAISGYVDGAAYRVKAANANTGAATITLNGLSAVMIKKWSSGSLIDLAAGDISAGQILELRYDGTYMQLSAAVSGPAAYSGSAYTSTTQTIANSTLTAISFENAQWDNGGIHSTVTNNTRFTAPVSGYYLANGGVRWSGTATTGHRVELSILKNGSTGMAAKSVPAINDNVILNISQVIYLSAGDYIEFIAWQDTGSSLAINIYQQQNFGQLVKFGG